MDLLQLIEQAGIKWRRVVVWRGRKKGALRRGEGEEKGVSGS